MGPAGSFSLMVWLFLPRAFPYPSRFIIQQLYRCQKWCFGKKVRPLNLTQSLKNDGTTFRLGRPIFRDWVRFRGVLRQDQIIVHIHVALFGLAQPIANVYLFYSLFLSASKLNTWSFCFQWFSSYQLTYCSSWLLHLTILLARQIYVGLLLGIFVFQFLWLFGSYARARHLSELQVAAGEGGGKAGERRQFGSIGGCSLKDSPLKNVGKDCPFSRCFLLNGGSNIMYIDG